MQRQMQRLGGGIVPESASQFRYRAFISYSHADEAWARWLLAKLEGYRIPADLVGKRNAGGDPIPDRLGRFFRDRDEVSAATQLADAIAAALTASEHLVVIASPAAARSAYVEAEIQEFHRLNQSRKRPGHVLVLIVDGEPGGAGGTDTPRAAQECFPPALRGRQGTPEAASFEPLAADARRIGDGRTRALAKIAAAMIGVPYDALVRRELRRKRRRRLALSAAAAAIVLALAGLGVRLALERQERTRLEAETARSERDRATLTAAAQARRAAELLAAGNRREAVRLAREALADDGTHGFIPEAYQVLYAALLGTRNTRETVDLGRPNFRAWTVPLADRQYLTITDQGQISIWSPDTGVLIRRKIDPLQEPVASPGASTVLFNDGMSGLGRFRPATRQLDQVSLFGMGKTIHRFVALSEDRLLACDSESIFEVALPAGAGGSAQLRWQHDLAIKGFCQALAMDSRGNAALATSDGELIWFDLAAQSVKSRTRLPDWSGLATEISIQDGLTLVTSSSQFRVFRGFDEKPLLNDTFRLDGALRLSADATKVVGIDSRPSDPWRLTIVDIKTGATRSAPCLCTIIDMLPGDRVLVLNSDRDYNVEARSIDTGEVVEEFGSFQERVTNIVYLREAATVVGFTDTGTARLVSRRQAEVSNKFRVARGRLDHLWSAGFVDANRVVTSSGGPNASVLTLLDWSARGWRQEALFPAAFGGRAAYPIPLGGGLLGLFAPSGFYNFEEGIGSPGTFRIVEAESTTVVAEEQALSLPVISGSETLVAVPTERGVRLYDFRKRAWLETAGPAQAPDAWALEGSTLMQARGRNLEIRQLRGAPATAVALVAAGDVMQLCVQSGGDAAVSMAETDTGIVLQRWDLARRQATAETRIGQNSTAAEFLGDFDPLHGPDRFRRAARCDREQLTIRGENGQQFVWRFDTGQAAIAPLEPSAVIPVRLAGGTSALLHRRDDQVTVTDATTNEILLDTHPLGTRISAVAFSPALGWLAVGTEDGVLWVWNVTERSAPIVKLRAHDSKIETLAFSSGNKWLLSAAPDGVVAAWPVLPPAELLAQIK